MLSNTADGGGPIVVTTYTAPTDDVISVPVISGLMTVTELTDDVS